MAILLCEVPLNKDRQRERGREREAIAAVELLVHSTHTKSCSCEKIKEQVDKWRYRCQVPLNKDTQGGRGRQESVYCVAVQSVYVLLL